MSQSSSHHRPLGDNHALLCGLVSGAMMRAASEAVGLGCAPFEVEIEVDGDGNYTGRTIITRPSGTWAIEVVPIKVSEL